MIVQKPANLVTIRVPAAPTVQRDVAVRAGPSNAPMPTAPLCHASTAM